MSTIASHSPLSISETVTVLDPKDHLFFACAAGWRNKDVYSYIGYSQLSLSAHVAAVCRSVYGQLRQLRQAVRSLSEGASKTLVQTFVSCRLDYCNSLFFGIAEELMNRLHSVQNAAACLVT